MPGSEILQNSPSPTIDSLSQKWIIGTVLVGGDYFEVSQTQAFLVVVWYCIQEYVIIFDKKISLTPPRRGLKFLINPLVQQNHNMVISYLFDL